MKPIISANSRIRLKDDFSIGDYSIVDDYCYFSTRVTIGKCSHIASNCTVAGGAKFLFALGDYCSVSSGVRIWCASNDFSEDLVVIKPAGVTFGDAMIEGDVALGNFGAVGSNAVIMPGNLIPEGVSIGALSFVPAHFKWTPWTVYAGVPIRPLKQRNKTRVLSQVAEIERGLRAQGSV